MTNGRRVVTIGCNPLSRQQGVSYSFHIHKYAWVLLGNTQQGNGRALRLSPSLFPVLQSAQAYPQHACKRRL